MSLWNPCQTKSTNSPPSLSNNQAAYAVNPHSPSDLNSSSSGASSVNTSSSEKYNHNDANFVDNQYYTSSILHQLTVPNIKYEDNSNDSTEQSNYNVENSLYPSTLNYYQYKNTNNQRSSSVSSDISSDLESLSPTYQRYLPNTFPSFYNPAYPIHDQVHYFSHPHHNSSYYLPNYLPQTSLNHLQNFEHLNSFYNGSDMNNPQFVQANCKLNERTMISKPTPNIGFIANQLAPSPKKNLYNNNNSGYSTLALLNNETRHQSSKSSNSNKQESIRKKDEKPTPPEMVKDNDKIVINCNNINFRYPTVKKSDPKIKVKLQDMDLWKQFGQIGTEMIITKAGRRMFPAIRVNISGLEPESKYIMFIDMVPKDDNRYRFYNNEWVVNGKGEPHFEGL